MKEKKGHKAEMIEDISLLIDVFFTFIAVFLGKIGMMNLSNISFGIKWIWFNAYVAKYDC